MRKKNEFILALLLLVNAQTFGQNKTVDKRLKFAMEFAQVFRHGILSNEEIIKKYVAETAYFKSDTIKKMADAYLDQLRELKDYDITGVIKYSEHEIEFAVSGVHSLGDDSTSPKKRQFELHRLDHTKSSVNIEDLYVIKSKHRDSKVSVNDGGIFILFDKNDKILSFAGMTIGEGTGLMQF